MRTIITDDVQLSKRSDELDAIKENKEVREIVKEIKSAMKELNVSSLSAPEIGFDKRIFCINFADNEIKSFINPVMQSAEGVVLSEESSLTLPGKRFLIPRANKVVLIYNMPNGSIQHREFVGVAASLVQQKINQLDGILLDDIGLEIDEQYDNATQEEREELIDAYLDSLDIKRKQIEKEIQEDPDLKKIDDAINYMSKANKGELEFEKI